MPPTHSTPENDFRVIVRELSSKYDQIVQTLNDVRLENAQQHGDVEATLASLTAEIKGLRNSTAVEIKGLHTRLNDVLKKGINDATEKIERKDRIIKVLSYVVAGLVGMLAGDRLHALGWIKDVL